jgi:hypothetical protein
MYVREKSTGAKHNTTSSIYINTHTHTHTHTNLHIRLLQLLIFQQPFPKPFVAVFLLQDNVDRTGQDLENGAFFLHGAEEF